MVYSWEEFPRATIANGLTIGIHRRRFVETSTLFSIFQRFRSSSFIPRSHDSTLNSFLRKLFRATTKVYSFVNCGFSRFQSRSGERYWMNSSLQISMNSINSTRCAPALPSLSLLSLSCFLSRSPQTLQARALLNFNLSRADDQRRIAVSSARSSKNRIH